MAALEGTAVRFDQFGQYFDTKHRRPGKRFCAYTPSSAVPRKLRMILAYRLGMAA
jgi:hypothetical protein